MMDKGDDLQTWRCERCGRILAKLAVGPGARVEVRCGCNTFNRLYRDGDQAVTNGRLVPLLTRE